MNPDLRAAVIAYLLAQAPVVSAFGATAKQPKFWADWCGPGIDLPYCVFMAPGDSQSYETVDGLNATNTVIDGQLIGAVFAEGRTEADALSLLVSEALKDAPLTFTNGGLFYFRPTGHSYPVVTAIGPDGSPVSTPSYSQMRYMFETTT